MSEEEFYNACQRYRHAPATEQGEVISAYQVLLDEHRALTASAQRVEELERELKVWEEEPCPECGEHHKCGSVARVKELEQATAAVEEMREALEEAIPLLWHDKVCDFASAFTKDCSCAYGKVLKQAQAALAQHPAGIGECKS